MAASTPTPGRWNEILHAARLRSTPARRLLLDTLAEIQHGTPEQLYARLEDRLAGLSLSTLYRSLETLAEHGVVGHTHLSGHRTSYQLASHADHAHLVCRVCGTVSEIDGALVTPFLSGLQERHAFVPDVGHLSVFGTCTGCPPERGPAAEA